MESNYGRCFLYRFCNSCTTGHQKQN